jgi:hypothetical protein
MTSHLRGVDPDHRSGESRPERVRATQDHAVLPVVMRLLPSGHRAGVEPEVLEHDTGVIGIEKTVPLDLLRPTSARR